jgi:DNA (cytosine-5)-methyltransferase 1
MGLPDSYRLPGNEGDAIDLVGDGVCVSVVRWLAEQVFEPILASAARRQRSYAHGRMPGLPAALPG